MRRPSCELMLRILLVAGDCRNSGRSASVSILAPWKLVLRTVSACSTELVSISLKDTAALFTCTETNRAKDRDTGKFSDLQRASKSGGVGGPATATALSMELSSGPVTCVVVLGVW